MFEWLNNGWLIKKLFEFEIFGNVKVLFTFVNGTKVVTEYVRSFDRSPSGQLPLGICLAWKPEECLDFIDVQECLRQTAGLLYVESTVVYEYVESIDPLAAVLLGSGILLAGAGAYKVFCAEDQQPAPAELTNNRRSSGLFS